MNLYTKNRPPLHCTELVQKHWSEIFYSLGKTDFGKNNDVALMTLLDLMALYFQVRSEWIECGSSSVLKNESGKTTKSPQLAGFLHVQQALSLMLKEFGLTPLSKARMASIAGKGNEPDDDLSKFFQKRAKLNFER